MALVRRGHGGRTAPRALQAAGIEFFFLPPYSPDLNLIEGVWRHVKHEEMPVRSYTNRQALRELHGYFEDLGSNR